MFRNDRPLLGLVVASLIGLVAIVVIIGVAYAAPRLGTSAPLLYAIVLSGLLAPVLLLSWRRRHLPR